MKATEFFRRGAGERVGEGHRVGEGRGVHDPRPRFGRHAGPSRPKRPRAGTTTLILVDPDDSGCLTARPNRRWSQLVVRVLASSLDRQLAGGRPPESGRLLAARAQVLVSPTTRRALAQSFDNVTAHARRTPAMRDPRMPLNRRSIIACEREIREMRDALLTPLPAPARGAAMASWLLSDGTGPLFDGHRSIELQSTIRQVIAQLDPTVTL